MNVGEFCNRNVVFMTRDESVREAARLMREHHVGDIVVIEQRQDARVPTGIVTDRDLVVEILARDVDPDRLTVGDIMTYELLTTGEEDDLLDAIRRMRHEGVRRLPVVDVSGALQGILTVDDMVELLSEQVTGLAGLISREQQRERDRRP